MKFTAIILFAASALFASVDARFGQEQAVGLGAKLSASGCFRNGNPTGGFGGQEIQNLLAASDPCAKLRQADEVVAAAQAACPGTAAFNQVVAAAMDLVVAERNFNPFAGNKDSVCTQANLPASAELQGLLQLVDPRTSDPNNKDPALAAAAASVNARSNQILDAAKAANTGPGNPQGLSMAELLAANGFAEIQNFNGQAAVVAGNAGAGAGGAAADNNNNNQQQQQQQQQQQADNQQQAGQQAGQQGAGNNIEQAKALLQQAIDILNGVA
ncbi:hypothetical protein HDU96_005344 [Phlyctochytrium bullatum]|nr:hypothetical protein HDU96_005344 [Phlyctochytrium bullatum]